VRMQEPEQWQQSGQEWQTNQEHGEYRAASTRPAAQKLDHAKGCSPISRWVAPKCIRSHLVFHTRNCAMADDRGIKPGRKILPAPNSVGRRRYGHSDEI